MTIFQSIFLGIVQGLTEFLPVSSSAHLVIVPNLLGWSFPKEEAFVFDVLVQVFTLLGVFAYFWRDLVRITKAFITGIVHGRPFADPDACLGWYLTLATIPAGLLGLTIKGLVESVFNSPVATAFFLFLTAVLLVIAERVGNRTRRLEDMRWKDALLFGLFQAVSIFPGVSRSGATITGGMIANFDRQPAARFSFLMSIPIMLAAGLLAGLDILKIPNLNALLPVFLPGFLAAAVTGYLVIRLLLGYLVNHSLYIFAAYCVLIGIVTLGVNLL
jgi:undecaprenyl-diphosphatase